MIPTDLILIGSEFQKIDAATKKGLVPIMLFQLWGQITPYIVRGGRISFQSPNKHTV